MAFLVPSHALRCLVLSCPLSFSTSRCLLPWLHSHKTATVTSNLLSFLFQSPIRSLSRELWGQSSHINPAAASSATSLFCRVRLKPSWQQPKAARPLLFSRHGMSSRSKTLKTKTRLPHLQETRISSGRLRYSSCSARPCAVLTTFPSSMANSLLVRCTTWTCLL